MSTMVKTIEEYLRDGCGRCSLFRSPDCKVHRWKQEIDRLREIVQETVLQETMKWGSPCYTLDGKNVLMIQALKNSCGLSFFKGSLLSDPDNLLKRPGENSEISRVLRFDDIGQISSQEKEIRAIVQEAITIERAGKKVSASTALVLVEELQAYLDDDPMLKQAFEALTKGRQRGYNLYFSSAKQAKTRCNRIEKYRSKIIAGKGMHD